MVLCASFDRCPHPYVPRWIGPLVRPGLLRIVPRFSQVKGLLGCYAAPALKLLVQPKLLNHHSGTPVVARFSANNRFVSSPATR